MPFGESATMPLPSAINMVLKQQGTKFLLRQTDLYNKFWFLEAPFAVTSRAPKQEIASIIK